MKINLEKLNDIYNKGGELKEILDLLLTKAIQDGDSNMAHIFYAFDFYEFDEDDLDDEEEILNVPLLLTLNPDLRKLILTPVKDILEQEDTSGFFDEFVEISKIFIPLNEYKQYERKLKLQELEKK